MKLKLLVLMILSPSVFYAQSVKDSLLKNNICEVVEQLEFMLGYDQTLRKYTMYATFDKTETNRIESLSDALQEVERDNRGFSSDTLSRYIWKNYIDPFDSIHTKKVIEITVKYGFPSNDRIKKYYKKEFKDPEFSALIILIHSPKIYWEELKILIKDEFEEGRINRCAYGYLLWHVNGRNNLKYLLENGYQMIKDENGKEILKAVDCN